MVEIGSSKKKVLIDWLEISSDVCFTLWLRLTWNFKGSCQHQFPWQRHPAFTVSDISIQVDGAGCAVQLSGTTASVGRSLHNHFLICKINRPFHLSHRVIGKIKYDTSSEALQHKIFNLQGQVTLLFLLLSCYIH